MAVVASQQKQQTKGQRPRKIARNTSAVVNEQRTKAAPAKRAESKPVEEMIIPQVELFDSLQDIYNVRKAIVYMEILGKPVSLR